MWKSRTMILLSFLFMLIALFIVEPVTVHACSCAEPPSIEDQMNRKTAIFTGKVLSLTKPDKGKFWSSADPVKAQFEVKTVWKGKLGSQTAVYTALSSASCGYEGFEVNKEYIVFAYGDPDRLETGLCEGTKTLASAKEDLKALGAGYEPSKEPISGEASYEMSTSKEETDNRLIIIGLCAVILIAFLLLVLALRRRRS
ncbi:hypothetical protein [Paenibacillus prosopidis]|uniref:Tissue inhibitor of metalloproteinase n=1 Tax=Paenibacillus prosopidis TaxID=630520 RepID=A0A368VWC4_9BACL|nr:hypothetical protein [Paenibacillus prosopidis]RCW46461.1 tissue inhibitor of metalloproteinase [Paenibacillus prosopidis]